MRFQSYLVYIDLRFQKRGPMVLNLNWN